MAFNLYGAVQSVILKISGFHLPLKMAAKPESVYFERNPTAITVSAHKNAHMRIKFFKLYIGTAGFIISIWNAGLSISAWNAATNTRHTALAACNKQIWSKKDLMRLDLKTQAFIQSKPEIFGSNSWINPFDLET